MHSAIMPFSSGITPIFSFVRASLPSRFTGHDGSYMHLMKHLRPLSVCVSSKGAVSCCTVVWPVADFTTNVSFEYCKFLGACLKTVLHAPVSHNIWIGCPFTWISSVGLYSDPNSNCSMLKTSPPSSMFVSRVLSSHMSRFSIDSALFCLSLFHLLFCPCGLLLQSRAK